MTAPVLHPSNCDHWPAFSAHRLRAFPRRALRLPLHRSRSVLTHSLSIAKLAVTRANKCAREAALIQINLSQSASELQALASPRLASHLLFYTSRTLVGRFISVARRSKHNCTALKSSRFRWPLQSLIK